MNPDQTAPKEQSDLGPYCLQHKPPKYENRQICHEWRANQMSNLARRCVP